MADVQVVVLVPYRSAPLQNREHHLHTLLRELPILLTTATGSTDTWAILVIEQSDDGCKFSRGRCLNAGARLASVRFPAATLVLHDVDLIPSAERAAGYVRIPPSLGILALNSDSVKYGDSEQYVGGVCAVTQATFRIINGFQNVFAGWGGEDDCLRDAIKAQFPPSTPVSKWLHKFTAGTMTDLELSDPDTCRRACDVPEYRSDKLERRSQRVAAAASGFSDGYAELVFTVDRERKYPDSGPHVSIVTVSVHVTLEPGWGMVMSKSRGVPYYFRMLTGESTYTLPGTKKQADGAPASVQAPPKKRRVSVTRPPTTSTLVDFVE